MSNKLETLLQEFTENNVPNDALEESQEFLQKHPETDINLYLVHNEASNIKIGIPIHNNIEANTGRLNAFHYSLESQRFVDSIDKTAVQNVSVINNIDRVAESENAKADTFLNKSLEFDGEISESSKIKEKYTKATIYFLIEAFVLGKSIRTELKEKKYFSFLLGFFFDAPFIDFVNSFEKKSSFSVMKSPPIQKQTLI